MIAITVARKPCSESNTIRNILEYECGALDIGGCRVSVDWSNDPTRRGWQGGTESRIGRWPANLILQHQAECVQTVEGSGRGTDWPYWPGPCLEHKDAGKCQTFHGSPPLGGVPRSERKETVATWSCAEGCPAADLDKQSGDRPVSGAAKTGKPSLAPNTKLGVTNMFQSIVGNGALHNDSGGASRFFFQVHEPPDSAG